MIVHIWQVITATVSNFVQCLTSGISAMTTIVYDETNGLTFVGILLLTVVGMGIVYWIFRLLRGLLAGLAR